MDWHDRWWRTPSARQGSVVSTLVVSLRLWQSKGKQRPRPPGGGRRGPARAPSPLPPAPPSSLLSHPSRWSLAPMNSLRAPSVSLGPWPRTESPQPVSSAKRRLSTDAMQLREVGKLDVYLRKIHWLQRPGPGVPPRALRPWGQPAPLAPPGVGAGGPRGAPSGGRPPPPARCFPPRRGALPPAPGTTWWLAWNCCCAGESDCLIETQLCEGTSWLVP